MATPPLVLVVDDDAGIREVMADVLADGGYEVRVADNGRQALNLLRAGLQPFIIFLDWMMPVMDGDEFLNEWSQDPRLSAIPVSVITASRVGVDRSRARFWLEKPFRLEELLQVAAAAHAP